MAAQDDYGFVQRRCNKSHPTLSYEKETKKETLQRLSTKKSNALVLKRKLKKITYEMNVKKNIRRSCTCPETIYIYIYTNTYMSTKKSDALVQAMRPEWARPKYY